MSNRPFLLLSLALLAAAPPAPAVDVPVAGRKLIVTRNAGGREKLVFVSTDPNLPLPASGGLADPSIGSGEGAFVEVMSSGASPMGAFVIPAGPRTATERAGWTFRSGGVPSFKYLNAAAPAGESVAKGVALKQGRKLVIVARAAGLALEGGEGTVGIRLTLGRGTAEEVRICAQFGGAGVVTRDEDGRFKARNAPATALADCSDASLGTYPSPYDAIPLDQTSCGPDYDDIGASTSPGTALRRVTLHGVQEICNDGSPAVFYIRPATVGGGHENDWLIWLEGGASCASPESCADRWCGVNQQATYGAAKMSSRWSHLAIKGNGIFKQGGTGEQSNFEDFNQVVTYYCSSDNYVGRHSLDIEPGATHPGYRIAFNGQAILLGILERLRQGVVSDDTLAELPPIDSNARILFTGTSGGGEGAIFNIDRVAAWAETIGTSGVASFQAAIDARVAPGVDDPGLAAQLQSLLDRGERIARFRNDVEDDSCAAFHTADPRYCTDPTHVLLHHVGQPFFIHQDLADPVVGPQPYPNMASWTPAARALLNDQFLQRPSLIEESALVTQPVPVILAPLCHHHVGFESVSFFDNHVELAPDPAVNINTNLRAWFDGTTPASLIDGIGGAVTTSCQP